MEALFVFQWSRLSDHIGRKPVLLVGVAGLFVSMISFGLSKTFWGLVVRFVGLHSMNSPRMLTILQSQPCRNAQRQHGRDEEHDGR